MIHTVLLHIILVVDQSTEVETISNILLTDRTLSLREHADVSAVLLSGKCKPVLAKYNVTLTECYCVCYANCPWRPPTEFEEEMKKEFRRIVVQERFYRQLILGVAFPVIFLLGLTGTNSVEKHPKCVMCPLRLFNIFFR